MSIKSNQILTQNPGHLQRLANMKRLLRGVGVPGSRQRFPVGRTRRTASHALGMRRLHRPLEERAGLRSGDRACSSQPPRRKQSRAKGRRAVDTAPDGAFIAPWGRRESCRALWNSADLEARPGPTADVGKGLADPQRLGLAHRQDLPVRSSWGSPQPQKVFDLSLGLWCHSSPTC